MKRLSIYRLTRMLPASIALSGIAALIGCVGPTGMNSFDGSTSASRRGSLISSTGGGIVQAGGVVEDGGGYQVRTANAVGDNGGIVQAGFNDGATASRRGSLFSDHGGVVQGGGWAESNDGVNGSAGRRGSVLTDRGAVMQSGDWVDGSAGRRGSVLADRGTVVQSGGNWVEGDAGRRGSFFADHGAVAQTGTWSGGWVDGDAGRRGSLFGDHGYYTDTGCASGNCGGGRGSLMAGRGGICTSIDRCAVVPPGALPAQNGSSVRAYHKVQKENADLDKYVVYQNEWYMNGTELGPYGLNHVFLTAKRLCAVNVPVIVQASPDGQLNEIRRLKIVEHLVRLGVPGNVDGRVVIGFPEALDLDGNEAPRIYSQMLTPSQGQNNGFGSSSFGNISGFNNNFSSGAAGIGGFGGFGGGGSFGRPFGF